MGNKNFGASKGVTRVRTKGVEWEKRGLFLTNGEKNTKNRLEFCEAL
jgi:hypothetical protein